MAVQNLELREHLGGRQKELQDLRWSWEPQWRDIARFQAPQRGEFWRTAQQSSRGAQKNQAIVDTFARFAIRTLRAGLMGGLTSPARPWFRLTVPDNDLNKSAAVRAWLDHVAERILYVFGQSNLYDVLPLLYGELGVFGTGSVFIEEDFHDVIRAYQQTVGSYWLAVDDRRVVDSHYRKIVMSRRAALKKFGKENLPRKWQDTTGKGGKDSNVAIWHAIEPNSDFEPGRMDAAGKRWRSVYWTDEADNDRDLIRVAGYEDWPLLTPRWEVLTDDPYGTGCGHEALPDVKSLQILGKRKHNYVDKGANPPMAFPVELKNQPHGITAGFANYFAGNLNEKVGRPLYQTPPAAFAPLQALIQDLRDIINRTYYGDLFLMISQMDGVQPRNQLEMMMRKEEKLLMLGPVLESLHGELLSPLIDRTYAIMRKHRLFAPPPPELHGFPVEVEMISMLAQAQKAVQLGAIERTVGFVGSIAGVAPQTKHKVDWFKAIDSYSDGAGTPVGIIRSDDEAQQLADAEAQQLAAAQRVQTGLALTEGAKNLSDTNIGGQNVLERATGTPPAQQQAA